LFRPLLSQPVLTCNLWSVKIQAPVRFEWAVQLGVLLPVRIIANIYVPLCSLQRPFAAMDSFEPHNSLSRPRGWPPPPRGAEAIKVLFRLGCLLCWSLLSQTYLSLPPLVLPSQFLTLLSPQPGASQAHPPVPLSSHYSLSLSFSQPSFSKGLSTLAVFLPHLQFPLQPTAS
uniref:Uncharacterized protein n=1 Tax=Ailuropoda melanoleuca TaxID=9646 RepID=A0A7N5KLM7_AILME